MNDLVIGVRLTGDGKQLVAEVNQSTQSFDRLSVAARAVQADSAKLSESQGRLASSYNGMTEAIKANNAGMFNASVEVQKILNKYDPLGTKLRSLEADFNALSKAASQGLTGSRNDAAVDKTYALLNAEMTKTKALMLEAGVATESNGISVKSLGLHTKEARQELMILGREAMTGDFSRMPRTFGTLVTSTNLLSAAFTPVGAGVLGVTAAVVAGVYMWSEWGNAAEAATKKAAKGLEDAHKEADKERRLTPQEKLKALDYRIQSVGLDVQYETGRAADSSLPNEQRSIAAKAAYEKRDTLVGLNRQKTEIEDQLEKKENKLANSAAEKWLRKAEAAEREAARIEESNNRAIASIKSRTQVEEMELLLGVKATAGEIALAEATQLHTDKLDGLNSAQFEAKRAALSGQIDTELALQKQRNELADKKKNEKYAPKLDHIYDGIFTPGANVIESAAESFGSALNKSVKKGLSDALVEKTGMAAFSENMGKAMNKAMSGNFNGMTSAEKGSMYLAVAAVAVSYLGNKETVMSAQQRQGLQGTGTVLGDYNAKSASIANGIDVIAKASTYGTSVTESMAASLKSVDASMKDFLTTAVRSMGGSFSSNMGVLPGQMSNPALRDTGIAAGAAAGAAIGSYFGPWGTVIGGVLGALGGATSRTDRVIADKGLNISGTLGQFRTGGGSINQYVAGVDNSSSMFGLYSSSDAWRKTQAVDGGVNAAFANIFSGVATTFKTAAAAMGKDASNFDAVMNGMNVNIGDLSLMNMSVTEQQTAIMNVVSKTSDQMAAKLFPEMVKFNATGEGMAQTVIRIVTQNEAVITAFNRMGGAQTEVGHSTFAMTDELTRAAGGLDKLLPSLQQFTKFYTTSANQFANTYAEAKTRFSGTAIDGLVSQQTTANDIAAYVRAAMASGIDANSKVRILDASNSFSAFLTSMKNGIDALRASYDGVTSARDGVVNSIKSLQQFNATLQDFRRTVVVDNTLLDPVSKAAAARSYFNDIAAKSAAGDAVAQGKLQSAGQSLLSASQTGSGSYAQYQADVNLVLKAVDNTAAFNDKAINNGKDMLSTLDSMNGISGEISKNTFATNTAIMDMARVLGGYAAATSALSIASSTASPEAKQALANYVGKADANFGSVLNALQQGSGSGAIKGASANQPVSTAVVTSESTAAAYTAAEAATRAQADAQAKATQDAQAAAQAAEREAAASAARKQAKAEALTFYQSYIPDKNFHTLSEHGEWLRALSPLERKHVDVWGGDYAGMPTQLQKHNKWLSDRSAAKAVYESLPSFAIGTNYLSHDMKIQAHAGEEITPRPYVDLQRAARDETNALLAKLVAGNTELRLELEKFKTAQLLDNSTLKTNTSATATLLDDISAGGGAMRVKVVSP